MSIALSLIFLLTSSCSTSYAFAPSIIKSAVSPRMPLHAPTRNVRHMVLNMASSPKDNLSGVIDLTDDEDDIPSMTNQSSRDGTTSTKTTPMAPFLSQGELSTDPNLLNPDFSDPKQTRVIIYIILTLVPILFLVPLMIGSRDLIPLDALPPVEM